MSRLHRTRTEPPSEPAPQPPNTDTAAPSEHVVQPVQAPSVPARRVPRTRTGSVWAALITAALITILLIIFLVQNTRSTEISFLWMTTTTPLAVALLIAAVGSVLLTLVIGTARITQLRRLIRKPRN
jgi:putative membrane protein